MEEIEADWNTSVSGPSQPNVRLLPQWSPCVTDRDSLTLLRLHGWRHRHFQEELRLTIFLSFRCAVCIWMFWNSSDDLTREYILNVTSRWQWQLEPSFQLILTRLNVAGEKKRKENP